MSELNMKRILQVISLLILLLVIDNSFFVVSPTEMSGTRWMGGKVMESTPIGPGIHFKIPFFESIDILQTSQSTVILNNLPLHTRDNQRVQISVGVLYL